jgi:hypothetical protein
MTATEQLSKLAELRAKTDRDLVSIIDNALGVGLLLAANERDVDTAGVPHRRATDIYPDTVMIALPGHMGDAIRWLPVRHGAAVQARGRFIVEPRPHQAAHCP